MGNCFSSSSGTEDAPKNNEYSICFVLGGPGSGKGTQSSKLVEEFDASHLSAGDLLRAHIKSGTPDGNMVAEMIKQGQIVPSKITVSLLEKAMKESGKKTFLIDGFPRNDENRARFEEQTGMSPKMVLFFDCSEDVMMERLMGRKEGRTDDNAETILKRFRVFKEESMPVVAWYDRQGKVAKISAEREVDDVYADVRGAFKKYML
jgi:UMP-CMP kinase